MNRGSVRDDCRSWANLFNGVVTFRRARYHGVMEVPRCSSWNALIAAVGVFMIVLAGLSSGAVADEFTLVTFDTSDGGTIEAALFKADSAQVVVMAHGAVFNKESWYPLAKEIQAKGVDVLSIDFRGYGNSKAKRSSDKHLDIIGAVEYLKLAGYKSVGLLGGSMGGTAVLRALDSSPDPVITKAVLLAPAGGPSITQPNIEKLFIVSEGDRVASSTRKLHEQSSSPKEIEVFSGSSHAQHLFKTEHAPALTKRIVTFLVTKPTQ